MYKQSEAENQPDSIKLLRLNSAFKYLQTGTNDSITRNLYFKTALKYYYLNDYDKYLQASRKVLKLSLAKNDSPHTAKAFCYIGEYFDDESQLDSAFYYYNKSNNLYSDLKDSLNTGRTILYKAGILFDAGNFAESEVESINALKMLRKQKNSRLIYEAYNFIGISLRGLNNYEDSSNYLNQAINQLNQLEKENYDKDKIARSRIICYNNIGTVYEKMQNFSEAKKFYVRGLNSKNLEKNNPKLFAMLLNNFAFADMKQGNFKNVEQNLYKALKIRDSLKTLSGIVNSKISLGKYYIKTKDTAKAKQYLLESYALAKQVKSSSEVLESLRLLTDIDTKKNIYYSELYFATNDSIQNLERNTRDKFARIAYETSLIREENEILSQENFNILVIGSVFFLVLGSLFLAYRLRVKNRELFFNEQQRQSNEKVNETILKGQIESELAKNQERERIAMELHDGIINSIFTTRFNLSGLETNNIHSRNQLITQLEKTEHEIRQISHDLRKKLFFEDKKLPEMLAEFIEKQQNTFKTVFEITIDSFINWNVISSHKKIHIYRIVQEAVQNVNKYSKSKMCSVFIMKAGGKISLRIIDQGIGFDPKKNKDGIGLKNIKDRTKKLEGTLEIHTSPGNGTIIEVVF
jgi:signal transduction histidine kinase